MSSFADLVRIAREHAGLTQKELAQRAGIDDSYVSRLERGTAPPPVREKVLAIADALGIADKRERFMLLLAAGYVSADDLEALGRADTRARSDNVPLLFGTGAFDMSVSDVPQPAELEEEALLARLRTLLRLPKLSHERRREYLELLGSFIAWLEFRQNT